MQKEFNLQSNTKEANNEQDEIHSNNVQDIINKTINTKLSLRKKKLNQKLLEHRLILQSSVNNYPYQEMSDYNINTPLSLEEITQIFNSITQQPPMTIYRSISSLRKATFIDLTAVNSFLQSHIDIQISILDILEKASQTQSNTENFASCDINIIYESLWLLGNLFCINNNPLFAQIKESNFTLVLISLLYFPNDSIAYHIIFCLSNMILEDDDYFINLVFRKGAFEKITKILKEMDSNSNKNSVCNILDFISNCIQINHSFDNIACCLQIVSNHFQLAQSDNDIKAKALKILVQISTLYDDSSKFIIQTGCLSEVISILSNTQSNHHIVSLCLNLIINLTADSNVTITQAYPHVIRLLKDTNSQRDTLEKALHSLINICKKEEIIKELISNDDMLCNRLVSLIYPFVSHTISYYALSLLHSLIILELPNYNRNLIYKGICVQMILVLNDNNTQINTLIICACLLPKMLNWSKSSNEVSNVIHKQIEENHLNEVIERYLLKKAIDKKFEFALRYLHQMIKDLGV